MKAFLKGEAVSVTPSGFWLQKLIWTQGSANAPPWATRPSPPRRGARNVETPVPSSTEEGSISSLLLRRAFMSLCQTLLDMLDISAIVRPTQFCYSLRAEQISKQ